jgi:GT2 family glycosyltransferase
MDAARSVAPITVAIPTYRREQVLLDTLDYLLALDTMAAEILVLDNTEQHESATVRRLHDLAAGGAIRWVKLGEPSIPAAMNHGLVLATQQIVLFLDDDIRPEAGLLAAHLAAHGVHGEVVVAGRVIQPWEEKAGSGGLGQSRFACIEQRWIREFMAGNVSIPRALAIRLRGFDENFVRVAYRFEADFAHRLLSSGGRIFFEPAACIHHLKAAAGGTRTFGDHLITWRPDHSVGAYYHALRTRTLREFLVRPGRAIATRYHLRHPWRMPATLLSELGGMLWALRLFLRGPRYIEPATTEDLP